MHLPFPHCKFWCRTNVVSSSANASELQPDAIVFDEGAILLTEMEVPDISHKVCQQKRVPTLSYFSDMQLACAWTVLTIIICKFL